MGKVHVTIIFCRLAEWPVNPINVINDMICVSILGNQLLTSHENAQIFIQGVKAKQFKDDLKINCYIHFTNLTFTATCNELNIYLATGFLS